MRSSRLLVLGALLAPVPAAAQSASPVPSVRVSATGEVRVKPDEGWVDLGVETQGVSAQAAAEANASTMQRVIQALVRAGVPRDQVETQGFNVFPEYEGRPDGGEPRLRGYRVSNVVTAHVADVSRVGSVIDAGLGAGANRVNGVRFGVREAARYREQALQEAVRRGRAEAQVLAGALGVPLGPVLEASTATTPVQPYPVMMRMEAAQADTPIQPGEQTITATVTLVYRLGA